MLSCTMKEKITNTVAVLMTSLSSGYFEQVRDLYWENPTATGEVVAVFLPSHEEYQQTEKHSHNRKACAEMYLLSLADKLVTSGWSTFGYVAQGLGGVIEAMDTLQASEPYGAGAMLLRRVDTGGVVPHVSHCEDVSWGVKLVSHHGGL